MHPSVEAFKEYLKPLVPTPPVYPEGFNNPYRWNIWNDQIVVEFDMGKYGWVVRRHIEEDWMLRVWQKTLGIPANIS